jgi:hypothetical protein
MILDRDVVLVPLREPTTKDPREGSWFGTIRVIHMGIQHDGATLVKAIGFRVFPF